jgi:ATP synthase A chain
MGDHLARFGEHFLCRVYTTNELTLFLLPQGVPFALAPFLVLLEAISYCFRALSLGIRLFANMMAGHSLVKILSGFAWTMLSMGGRATVTTPSAVLPHLISGKLLQQPAAKRIWLTRSTEDHRMPNKKVRASHHKRDFFIRRIVCRYFLC